jgi:octaprenyl-diphosphate synthase
MNSLDRIIKPFSRELKEFQKTFDQALKSDVKLINTVGKYMIKRRGKRIRPALTILVANLCGKVSESTYRSAAMIEMLHIATLIHDDVVDEASIRRGWPSINRVWKNKIAVLMGDYVLSQSLIYMVKMRNFEILDIISKTAENLSSGEMLQIEKNINKNMNEDTYYKMISRKTGSLISSACELGAITSSGRIEDRENMRSFGNNLGLAFQVKDDILDFVGNESETGKETGADVKKNLMTLPIIYTLENTPESNHTVKRILRAKNKNRSQIEELNNLISAAGGIDYAFKKMKQFSFAALEMLKQYPESTANTALQQLVEFNLDRKK